MKFDVSYETVGKMWAKKFYNRKIAFDGAVEAIAGFLIPANVVPTKYWLRSRIGSIEGTTPFPPHYFCDYRMNGRMMPLAPNIDIDATANDTLQEMMNLFAPAGDASQPYNEKTGVQAAHGKIGTDEEDIMPMGTFFNREKRLGLPESALFSSSDSIYLFDHIQTKGRFHRNLKTPDEASLLVFSMWIDEPAAGTTELDNLVGSSAGGRTLNDLTVEALAHFQDDSYTTGVSDTGDVDQTLMNWLSSGMIFDALPTLTGDEALNIATHLTVEFEVQVPHGRNSLSAPG